MNKNLLSRLTWALLAAAVLLAGIQAYLLLRPSPAAAQAGVQAGAQASDASSAPLSSPAALAEPSAFTASSAAVGREPEAAAAAIPAAPANRRAGGTAPLAANAATNTAAQSQSGSPAPEACQSAGAASASAAHTREASSHKARASAAPLAMSEQTDNRDAKARRRDSARVGSHGASLLMRLSGLCLPDTDAEAQAPLAPANLSAAPAALSAEDAVAYDTPESSDSFAPAPLTAEGLKSADEIPACSEEQHEDSPALPSALNAARNSASDSERAEEADLEDAEAPGDLGSSDAADTRTAEPRNTRKALATRQARETRDAGEARGAGHAPGSRRARNGLHALDARNALDAPPSSLRNESAGQNHASPAPVGLLQSSDGDLSLAADFALYREALEGIDDCLPARRGTERVLFTLPGGEGAQVSLRWQADRGRISSLSADLRTAQETRDLRLVIHLLRQSCAGGAEVLDLGLYLIRLPEPGQSAGFVHRAAFLRLSADGQAVRFGD